MDLSLFSLEGKTALVTGVSRGLGQAMAAALAKAGADIVGVGPRGLGSTRSMIESAGRRAFEVKADLSAGDTAAAVAEEAIAAFGKIDILVNNAGIIKLSPAQEHTMEDFDAVMELNLRSLFLLTRDIARQMIALGHGKIINTCSVQSFRGGSGDAAYVASKHAVHGLTRAWARPWTASRPGTWSQTTPPRSGRTGKPWPPSPPKFPWAGGAGRRTCWVAFSFLPPPPLIMSMEIC